MPHDGTSHEPLQTPRPGPTPDPNIAKKEACEAKGGIWDSENQVCIPAGKREPTPTDDPVLKIAREKNISLKAAADVLVAQQGQSTQKQLARQTTENVNLEQQEAQRLSGIEAERQRIIAEEVPQRRELSPELTAGEKIPIVGGVIGLINDSTREKRKEQGLDIEGGLQPEELRSFALSEIERQEIERGLTESESFGRAVEATGLSRVSIFGLSAKDLIETPSENARETFSNVRKEKRRLTNIETNVKLGYLPVSVAQEQVKDIEQNVQRLESRIRLLVSSSPELRFNSDFVNTMETEILGTKEKIFQSKQNILTGQTNDPTEIQILQALRGEQGVEDEG